MSKILNYSIFILLIIQLSLLAQFAGGSGTEADPWLIRTPENLDSLRFYLGVDNTDKYFKQIADIDLGVAPWNVGEGWEPIGRDSTFFQGNYDGDGFKISNLTINRPDEDYIGLFGSIMNPILKHINLTDVNLTGRVCTGALAGLYLNTDEEEYGLISESRTDGSITGAWGTGGLIGSFGISWSITDYNVNKNITDCYSRNSVSALSGASYTNIGGLVGNAGPLPGINNSYSTGAVNGGYGFCGGSIYDNSIGNYWDVETSGRTSSCSAEGRTTKEMTEYAPNTYEKWDFGNIWAEDIYGINDGYPVLQSQLAKDIPGIPDITSVEINDLDFHLYWNNPSLTRTGEILSGLDRIYITRDGTLVHTIESPATGSSADFSETLTEPGYYTYRIYGENSSGLGILAKTSQIIGQMFSGGTGTEADPYLISSGNDINNIRFITGYIDSKKYFMQISDIDMNVLPWNEEPYWEPIEYFTDIYDGGGFKIKDLAVLDYERNRSGLFRDTYSAKITDLIFENSGVIGNNSVGCIAGSASSTLFKNIAASVHITGVASVGGLTGNADTGTSFVNCKVTGELTSSNNSGGLTGTLDHGGIYDCTTDLYFYNYPSRSGGLIGRMTGSNVSGCSSDCELSGKSELGGLIGSIEDYLGAGESSVSQCFSAGSIDGTDYLGGLIGSCDAEYVINDCYSTASVKGSGGTIGGFCGNSNGWFSEINNCYSNGYVDAEGALNSVGGFIGYIYSTAVNNSYWNIETSGQNLSISGEGRTTDEMINPILDFTYTGWDFENTWQIDPLLNGGYPYLKWQNLTGIEDQSSRVPKDFTLSQNYPNPFNPVTKISYSIPQGFSGDVKLSIYNANGQLVKELVNEKKSSGMYSVEFHSEGLNSGMYFYRLKTANSDISKKMILLK